MKVNYPIVTIIFGLCFVGVALFNKLLSPPPSHAVIVEIFGHNSFRLEGGLSSSPPKTLREILKSAYNTFPTEVGYRFDKEVTSETVVASLNAAADRGFSKISIGCVGSSKVIIYDIKSLEKYYVSRQPLTDNKPIEVDGIRINKVSVNVKNEVLYLGNQIELSALREKLVVDASSCDILLVDFLLAKDLKMFDWWEGVPSHEQAANICVWITSTASE